MSAARNDPALVVALENKQDIAALRKELATLGKRCRTQQEAFDAAQKKQKQETNSWKERAVLAEQQLKHMDEKVRFTEQLQKGNQELEGKLKDVRAQFASCQRLLEKEKREKLEKYQSIQNKYHQDTQDNTKRAMQRLEETHAEMCDGLEKYFDSIELPPEKRNGIREVIIPYAEKMRLCIMG